MSECPRATLTEGEEIVTAYQGSTVNATSLGRRQARTTKLQMMLESMNPTEHQTPNPFQNITRCEMLRSLREIGADLARNARTPHPYLPSILFLGKPGVKLWV